MAFINDEAQPWRYNYTKKTLVMFVFESETITLKCIEAALIVSTLLGYSAVQNTTLVYFHKIITDGALH